MVSWLDRPGSLNWANRKKLNNQIKELDENISSLRGTLLALLSLVNHWSYDFKELLELDSKNKLTAKHIIHLKPLIERIKYFQSGLDNLNEICKEELAQISDSSNNPNCT
jgi:hypothetical protein